MATILVVDDLQANREVIVSLLGYKGHRLIEAGNGREGLAAAAADRPDLVITDVLMPVMDGYDFVKALRLEPATSAIPIIFYTAHYSARDAKDLALAGGVAYVLTKPAEPVTILETVERALSGRSDSARLAEPSVLSPEFDREHLRLLTDKLSETTEGLKTSNSRLRALINIGLELASERDGDRLVQKVCDAARDLFAATYVTVGLVSRRDQQIERIVAAGADVADWASAASVPPPFFNQVISQRQTRIGHNASGDPTNIGLPLRHPRIHAFLAAPLASPSHVYGWICLVGNERQAFDEDDRNLLQALAGQVGRIYENGYYYSVAQKRADELQHERDRAQRYLDTAEVIMLALDLEGRITLINRHACTLLGWTREELIGRDWVETCLPSRVRTNLQQQFDALVAGNVTVVENPVISRSGDEWMIEWRNTLLRDEHGRVVGTLSSGTDVTERNAAVDALRRTEERMRFALESADIGIWDMDYTTGELRWSDILQKQYGFALGTFGGTFDAFQERIHPGDRERVLAVIGEAMKRGEDFAFEHRTLLPDGSVKWLSGAGRIMLGGDGKPVRGVGISLDVTKRHSLEAQYLQAQKMEAVGRLAGGVAHDFNNLLTCILGYCELMLDDTSLQARGEVLEIQKAGNIAAGLTRQLLSFSRKQIVEPTSLDASHVIGEMRDMLTRLIGEDVSITFRLGALPFIVIDRGQLEQVVLNLVVNARDAMPDGGSLIIEAGESELDQNYCDSHLGVKPGTFAAITVTDSGTGISPEVQARLFEPFFTTKEQGKGTGLGLSTVHGIVTRFGGSIGVYSELGKGTAFTVYLPKGLPTERATPATGEFPPLSRAAVSVLVVDDSEGVRVLASRLLERMGYRVFAAANATEAIQEFREHPDIDVLLTDVVMPGASGPEMTTRLVEQHPALKVVYMSGYTEDAITRHGVLNPGIAFLHKPFTSATLGQKIRDVLG